MKIGGKALLMKAGTGDRFVLVVLSAALKLNSNALRKQLHVDRLRFATVEELKEMTGCVYREPLLRDAPAARMKHLEPCLRSEHL